MSSSGGAACTTGSPARKPAEADPLRAPVRLRQNARAILLPGYWFTRYILFERDSARAARIEWPAAGLWLILFALHGLQQWWTLFGPSLTGLMGLTGTAAQWTGYTLLLLEVVAGIYFTAWTVAWALGNASIGPLRSARVMTGHFWRTVLLSLAGVLPLMIAHYSLSFGAIFAPAILDWPLLLIDALVVGLLALTMARQRRGRGAACREGRSASTCCPNECAACLMRRRMGCMNRKRPASCYRSCVTPDQVRDDEKDELVSASHP